MSTTLQLLDAELNKLGYQTKPAPATTRGYTLEATKGSKTLAVLLKEHKAKVNIATVQQFQDFLSLDPTRFTDGGWLISTSGFFKPALTHVNTEIDPSKPEMLRLGTFANGQLIWDFPLVPGAPTHEPPPEPARLRYFGIFTCKGGVGKTTVAAHLAGAFALMGYDVILLDLDPDKNLRKLFLQDPSDEDGDASLFVPAARGQGTGATITVLNHDEWNEKQYPHTKIVVCDCSPVLSENPKDLVAKFDYCIIPTTLNPLGVAKKADVITRTFEHIRKMNSKANMFAMINGYDATKEAEARNTLLLDLLGKELAVYTEKDPKCTFIHPNDAKIRYSTSLFYWGIHIVRKSTPELAFRETAGRSNPRVDFLGLAEYLENHTAIAPLRGTLQMP